MFRHLLRATVCLIVLCGSLFCLPSSADAQGVLGARRWLHGARRRLSQRSVHFYYAFYLPNQQLQSLRPRPIDTLNQAMRRDSTTPRMTAARCITRSLPSATRPTILFIPTRARIRNGLHARFDFRRIRRMPTARPVALLRPRTTSSPVFARPRANAN